MALTRRSGPAVSVNTRPTCLQHPTPSFDGNISPYGPHSRNIMNLEQKAEEISSGGSDIGEEIRRMNDESKFSSRQNSIQSSHQGEVGGVRGGGGGVFGRTASDKSLSSLAHSAVGVNGAARHGGYSPSGYITSPVGSAPSGSWSQVSNARKASASGSSRLAQMIEPIHEGRPLDSPLAPSVASYGFPSEHLPSRQASQSSVAQRYHRATSRSLEHVATSPEHVTADREGGDDEHFVAGDHTGAVTPPDRSASSNTFQEADVAFRDFDGVHFSPHNDDFLELDALGHTPRARPLTYAEPPPDENMVYYPAPVPRMLNLPKRLSQLPAASVQAKRRSQMMGDMQSGYGSSMMNQRMSRGDLQGLPPQLRASMFFDHHQPLQQDINIKSESAVATLDNILAASANAPVNAFTDHPYAGDVRSSVFAPERIAARRSTTTPTAMISGDLDTPRNLTTKRSSTFGNLLRRASSGDKLNEQLQRNGSRSSLLLDFNDGGKKLQKRKSQMSLGDDLDQRAAAVRTPGGEQSEADMLDADDEHAARTGLMPGGSRAASRLSGQEMDEGSQIAADFHDQEALEDVDDGEAMYAPPTTLLAELQVRKAFLKSRTRTAVTSFPNGMHSTLLQLDAVEEIINKKRKKQRVPLAWEDHQLHQAEEDSDEEVPLGMLYPGKAGLIAGKKKMGDGKDWGRQLGLMEKRELEDNEPLRSRKNRLQGLPPSFGRPRSGPMPGMQIVGQSDAMPEDELENEDELANADETIAQRTRRLKTKGALDGAIADITPDSGDRGVSTFADDLLGQFGGLDVNEKSSEDAVAGAQQEHNAADADEEETLGQRKARLQREREASGEQAAPVRPAATSRSNSMANLLSTNPVVSGNRKISRDHKPAEGTLLHANAQQQAKQRAQILSTNVRASSYGAIRPLIETGARPQATREFSNGGLLGQQANRMSTGFPGGIHNNGVGAQQSGAMSTPMFGMNGANAYFPSPTAFNYQGMMGYQQQAQQFPAMMNPLAYQALSGGMPMPNYGYPMAAGHMYGVPQMQYGLGMAPEEPLDPKQRDAIDQWRLSVAQ